MMRNPTAKPRGHTQVRIAKIKQLIAALSLHEMRRDEIETLLEFSPSGSRKYVVDLGNAHIIELARFEDVKPGRMGHPVYRLTADADLAREFLADLDLSTIVPRRKPLPRKQSDVMLCGPSRRFHLMQDDTHFAVRVSGLAVSPDPGALPREFFASVSGNCGLGVPA
jgi:hypothetical protein